MRLFALVSVFTIARVNIAAGADVVDLSIYCDASSTRPMRNGVLTIPKRVQSHEISGTGIVVDTNAPSIHVNVEVRPDKTDEFAVKSSYMQPASHSQPGDQVHDGHWIPAIGDISLGLFVGLMVARALFKVKSVGLKLVAGLLGSALGGAPVAFLSSESPPRFLYPVGLLLGLLSLRLIQARAYFGSDARTRR